jgi:hypothetical protein
MHGTYHHTDHASPVCTYVERIWGAGYISRARARTYVACEGTKEARLSTGLDCCYHVPAGLRVITHVPELV